MLNDLGELFEAPAADPLKGRFETRSGLDRVRDAARTSRVPLRLDLTVLEGPVAPGDQERAARAVQGYCAHTIEQLTRELHRVSTVGRKGMIFGLSFLAVCLVASGAVSALHGGPEWLRESLSEGLIIIGWIALWHPVDALFFDRLPLVKEKRVLRRVQHAEVRVHGAA